jgi:hypothetical protein
LEKLQVLSGFYQVMALEWRGNNLYYYEKERNGDRVRSVYAGKGETADLFHSLNLLKKREENETKEGKHREKERRLQTDRAIDSDLDQIQKIAGLLTDALFLANGYHQHKRQWRKKRDGK